MRVTLRQLQVFESVARNLSFTRAALELHLTQPAVSMQIRQLEGSLEIPLFDHLGKKTYLTDAGNELFDYSRRVGDLLRELEEVVEELKGVQWGRLGLSVVTTANHFATRLLAGFMKQYPKVTFSLDVSNRQVLIQQLRDNERDLVLMGKPPAGEDVVAEPFLENPLVVIAPPDHPLVSSGTVPVEQLAGESFVVREPGSGTRGAAERFFSERGVAFPLGMEMSSNEAIKHAVEAGLGLAVVSIHTLELELEVRRLVILDVEGFPILRHWYLVHRKGKRLSPTAQAFRRFVLEEASRFVSRARGAHSVEHGSGCAEAVILGGGS